jgi:SOS-response transcriptional repressor LexA
MPGGSGLLDQICEGFDEIVAAARDVVEKCPSACSSSCVDCLQTFRNGYYHKYLDRKLALECLDSWGRSITLAHEIPTHQPSAEPTDGSHPVNEKERRLRHLLRAAGFEEGVRGEQLRLDRSIGTTTPDVIYRGPDHAADEGICIYLDGLSNHLHGNARTSEQDQRIRSWLRNHGWEVIEITSVELDDQEAMTRHFRKLAGYLGAAPLKAALAADRAWFERAGAEPQLQTRTSLRVVKPDDGGRYRTCVPLVPLKAAAGGFGEPSFIEDGQWEWVEVDSQRQLRAGMFVAQVVGKSMEPLVPDGAHCLFTSPVTGSRQGRVVLVALRDETDPETGERFTIKRYESEKVTAGDGAWRHVRVTLKPRNPAFSPIVLTSDDEGQVQVIAELVEVLG